VQRGLAYELDRQRRMAALDAWLDELDAARRHALSKGKGEGASVARLRHSGSTEAQGGEGHQRSAASMDGGLIVVLDTGGIEDLVPIDEERRARLRPVASTRWSARIT